MNLAELCTSPDPSSVALISRGRQTTYGELCDQAGHLRGGLVANGVQVGDRVAVVAANNWYFVVSYLAIIGVGAVAVPLNPASPGPELTRELNAAGASAVILGPTSRRSFSRIDRAEIPAVKLVVTSATGEDGIEGAVSLDDLLASAPTPIESREPDDLATLIFTSGTAGFPKAAMLTHGNLLSNLEQIERIPNRTQNPDDVTLGVLPFFHIFGLNAVLNQGMRSGSAILAVERFDPESALDAIVKHKVTIISGAPTMWSAWAHLPGARADAFSTVRVASSGASKLDLAVRQTMIDRFGLEISEGYGLTEASPVVTSAAGLDAPPGSIGAPIPGVRLRILDADGHDVLVGDAGELQVQGPNVFAGYWNDEEATADILTSDGWLRTGDLAVVDDNGFLFIVDRMKDLIIVSGFNVYPAEVEAVILEHPGVEMAAVVGVQHPHSGEAIKAYVVAADGVSVEEDDIIAFCEQRLARYKCPHKVIFVEEIPVGIGGKVLRRTLR